MKVLVLGASGFIGFPVAQAFVRAGHIVYGQTRSASNSKRLAAEEITPVVDEPTNDSWLHLIGDLDVVVDTIGGFGVREISPRVLQAVSEAAKSLRPAHAPKLSYILTSGIWVHGDDRKAIVSDTTPLRNPVEIVAWRVEFEQQVIHHPVLNGIVVRPALLYGRGGSLTASLFKSASEGTVTWYGTPGGRFSLVHCDDLADLYVKVAEKAPLLGGLTFNAANEQTESVDDLLEKLVEVSNAKGHKYIQPSNVLEVAFGTTTLNRPYLARALLGWQPRKPGLVDGLSQYYAAYLASL